MKASPVNEAPVCRSPEDIDEILDEFSLWLDKIHQEIFDLSEELEKIAETKRLDCLSKTLARCHCLTTSPARLLRRKPLDEKRACYYRNRLKAVTAREDPLLYSIALTQALLFNEVSSLGPVSLDLLPPPFLKLYLNAVAFFLPSPLEEERALTRDTWFFCHFFASLLNQKKALAPLHREWARKRLLPDFATLFFLGGRTPMRNLRNALNVLTGELYAENGLSFSHVFPKRNPKARPRIGFLSYGNSSGHGWPSLRLISNELKKEKADLFLITWPEDPCLSEGNIEEILVSDNKKAVRDIRNLNLDVLFFSTPLDRNLLKPFMEMAHYRLARLHATAFFNNTTTAFPFMDVMITSPSMDDPNEFDRLFYEPRVVSMKNLPFAFDPETYFPDKMEKLSREDIGVPEDAKIVVCGNSLPIKARAEFIRFMARFLAKNETCYFVLTPYYTDEKILFFKIRKIFAEEGIREDRVRVIDQPTRERQYGLLRLADLYMDFFPFSGANSLFDPLWMKVPVLTLETEHAMRFRQGAAILRDMGLEECVATDLDDLEAKGSRFLGKEGRSLRKKLGPKCILSCSAFDGRSAREIADKLMELTADLG